MEHVCDLADRIGNLLFHERSSDVTLIVEGESLPAHRGILGVSSEYFRALLLGDMKESTQGDVVLREVPLRGFKLLLSYIYTDQLKVDGMDVETVLEILELAHLYGFQKLQVFLCENLQGQLNLRNVCAVFSVAHRLQVEALCEVCRCMIIEEALVILRSDEFCDLSEASLCSLVSDDTFCAKEIEIFAAVARWCTKRPAGGNRSNVLGVIRLPLINSKDLLTAVMDSGLVAKEVIFEAIRMRKCQATDLKFRASLRSGVNLADPDLGACQASENPENIFTDTVSPGYRFESLPPFPSVIKFDSTMGLTIALREPCFLNHLAFKISGKNRSCYHVEISVDLKNWARIIDYRDYPCHSFQKLYFESRAARFIRLMVPKDNSLRISTLEVMHVSKPPKLIEGFLVPEENVATTALGTLIRIAREVNGSVKGEDVEEAGWTHDIDKNQYIVLFFPQPYVVDSLRMLLKDDDESRAYKFYIETLTDSNNKWRRVADYTANFCRSWQRVTFDAHPVLGMRIVGTASSVDKHFSVSRFECPAPADDEEHRLS